MIIRIRKPFLARLSRRLGTPLLCASLIITGASLPLNEAKAGGGYGGRTNYQIGYSHYSGGRHSRGGGNGAAIAVGAMGLAAVVGLIAAQSRSNKRYREREEAYDAGREDGYYDAQEDYDRTGDPYDDRGQGDAYDDRGQSGRYDEDEYEDDYGQPEDEGYGEELAYDDAHDTAYDDSAPSSCRRSRPYTETVIIDGRPREVYGRECQLPNGSWHRGSASVSPDN